MTIDDTTQALKKKEDIHAASESSKKIENVASHFYECFGVGRFNNFLLCFILKTMFYCIFDLTIIILNSFFFETSILPSYHEDFPTSAKCHISNEHIITNVNCQLNLHEGLRKIVLLYTYGHLTCFLITLLVLLYYLFLFTDCCKVTSKKKLMDRMKAPLYKLIEDSESKYSVSELFVLYYISFSGIEPVTFKIFVSKYELLKKNGVPEFEFV